MSRPKTIFVDEMQVLAGIQASTERYELELAAWLRKQEWRARPYAEEFGKYGVHYDLDAFSGRDLTPSERVRWREAIQSLHAQGLVILTGKRATHVLVTPEGKKALRASVTKSRD